jgi:hypothetical protein
MLNMFEETSTKNIVIGIILPDGLKLWGGQLCLIMTRQEWM